MIDIEQLDWNKQGGLLPAIVQHAEDGRVLMLAYMNRDALEHTIRTGRVTFWSRSRNELWTKGETSGHHLSLESVHADCDHDTLLVRARPAGPTCHRGTDTCFDADDGTPAPVPPFTFLGELERLVARRERERPEGSYTTELFESGLRRLAQKVGEEGVETALAGVGESDNELAGEAADLVYHLIVLLRARGLGLGDVIDELQRRHGA